MEEPLDEVGARVLASLLEKELTTPDNYPMTLKALTAACNQRSSRDPVMELDEATVTRSLADLQMRSLARGIHRGDARVMRYRQEIGERMHLHRPERAALSVLMLRGPQTAGEIKTRTARAFEFVAPSHVEVTLESMAELSPPLVAALPRRPGQKEVRYTHLLCGHPLDGGVEEEVGEEGASEGEVAEEEAAERGSTPGASPRRATAPRPAPTDRVEELERELGSLRDEVTNLKAEFDAFRRQFE
jgi:uncharacterized protein YceH (UPF0502 family)